MKLAVADPPYPGCAELYRDHPDYAGEVDHKALLERLQDEFDGWVLHTNVPGLRLMERNRWIHDGVRICGWFKSFAAFKRNVSVAYAWEPVIIKAARKPEVTKRIIYRDFLEVPDWHQGADHAQEGTGRRQAREGLQVGFRADGRAPGRWPGRYVSRHRGRHSSVAIVARGGSRRKVSAQRASLDRLCVLSCWRATSRMNTRRHDIRSPE